MTAETLSATPEATGTYPFSRPSVDEARRILRELDWGEHLIGIDMNPAAGNRDVYLYSLKEAAKFLQFGAAGMGLSTGGKGSISWFEVDRFVVWIRDVIGDPELADAIARDTASETSYHGKVQKLGHLIDARLVQLNELVDETE